MMPLLTDPIFSPPSPNTINTSSMNKEGTWPQRIEKNVKARALFWDLAYSFFQQWYTILLYISGDFQDKEKSFNHKLHYQKRPNSAQWSSKGGQTWHVQLVGRPHSWAHLTHCWNSSFGWDAFTELAVCFNKCSNRIQVSVVWTYGSLPKGTRPGPTVALSHQNYFNHLSKVPFH